MKLFLPLLIFYSIPVFESHYNTKYYIERNEVENGLPKGILSAIAKVESNLNPNRVTKNDGRGRKTSYGLLQIQESSAKQVGFRGSPSKLISPELNIYYGAKYFKWLLGREKGDVAQALNCYNLGPSHSLCKNKSSFKYSEKVLNAYIGNRM